MNSHFTTPPSPRGMSDGGHVRPNVVPFMGVSSETSRVAEGAAAFPNVIYQNQFTDPERKHIRSKPGTADGQAIVRRSTTGAVVRVGQTPPCLRDRPERRPPIFETIRHTEYPYTEYFY